jgi:hypothetical protein
MRVVHLPEPCLNESHSKLTYVWEQYLFHYISEGGFTYLVMADDAAGRYVHRQSWKDCIYGLPVGECLSPSSQNFRERQV